MDSLFAGSRAFVTRVSLSVKFRSDLSTLSTTCEPSRVESSRAAPRRARSISVFDVSQSRAFRCSRHVESIKSARVSRVRPARQIHATNGKKKEIKITFGARYIRLLIQRRRGTGWASVFKRCAITRRDNDAENFSPASGS